jgi:hypothetical protein
MTHFESETFRIFLQNDSVSYSLSLHSYLMESLDETTWSDHINKKIITKLKSSHCQSIYSLLGLKTLSRR